MTLRKLRSLSGRLACTAICGALLFLQAKVQAEERSAIDADSAVKAAILPIETMITDVTVESLGRRIKEAKDRGVAIIVFELDTPGGLVTSSIAIADLIKNLEDIETIAWVNPNAHSGGTIVAVACNEIVMARSSRMGDSQVISIGPSGAAAIPKELQPKAYTPVLSEFRASCRLNGYNQNLCEAFVLPDREVWWVENTLTRERDFVFREEKMKLLGEVEKKKAKKTEEDKDDDEDGDESTAEADSSQTVVTQEKSTTWILVESYYDSASERYEEVLQPVVPDTQLLEMSPGEAEAYGFSTGIVADEEALRIRFNIGSIFRLAPSWSEALAFWMTSIYVRGFLFIIIMLGAYVEFHTPGVGVPGLVALICLIVFVGAPYLTGLANVWEVVCLVLGFLLIALEVLVIPGFGLPGIAGIVLVLVGVLATFVPEEPGRSFPIYMPSLPESIAYLKAALLTLVASMAASLVGMVMMSRYLPRLAAFQRIVPPNPTPSEVQPADEYHGLVRVGDLGETAGPLRPAGKARFGGTLVDVVTQGEYVEPQTKVEIIERRGNHVVVRAVV